MAFMVFLLAAAVLLAGMSVEHGLLKLAKVLDEWRQQR